MRAKNSTICPGGSLRERNALSPRVHCQTEASRMV
ncbi:hypothetical protein DSM3645_03473 [Blastopirellula marina DSM 3645]|uniref:Uncharacterized protein n=1 Tax=Blastopirellula marina DSM 3645 TaxID=314230 RepID=A3ZW08_9BACT|nr:hypothetical protein DSM3645_03473 [Blastopirellula marina DSM 3645]